MLEVYIRCGDTPVTPEQLRDELGLKTRPLQQIKNLAMDELVEWVDRSAVLAKITQRGRDCASAMALKAADAEALAGDPSTRLDDITEFQLAILRAMATAPSRRWHAEQLAPYMPGGDMPTRPSLRRLVWKGLLCTESPSPLGDRLHWLTAEGMVRATGEVRDDLPGAWTYESALAECGHLSKPGFFMLRAMITSEHKDWSLTEMESVMPRGMSATREAAIELQNLNLAIASSEFTIKLTSHGFRVGTGRTQPSFRSAVANVTSPFTSGAASQSRRPEQPQRSQRRGRQRPSLFSRAMSTVKIMFMLMIALIIGLSCLAMAIRGCSSP